MDTSKRMGAWFFGFVAVVLLVYAAAQTILVPIDIAVVQGAVQARSAVVTTIAEITTTFGREVALALVVVVSAVLFSFGRRVQGARLLVATLGAVVLQFTLKAMFERPRPPVSLHLVEEFGAGFPSGHALVATVVYGYLAWLLRSRFNNAAVRRLILFGAILIIATVATSRIYLGVHWPSDVVAGIVVGVWWLRAALTTPTTRV